MFGPVEWSKLLYFKHENGWGVVRKLELRGRILQTHVSTESTYLLSGDSGQQLNDNSMVRELTATPRTIHLLFEGTRIIKETKQSCNIFES